MGDATNAPVTLGELRSICRKGGADSREDPFLLARYLYRPISIYFTWASIRLGLSANGVTVLSGLALLTAAVLYSLPEPTLWLVGGALAFLYVILDNVDGELARYERERLDRSTGMTGLFYDSACHPGEMAVAIAIALRLFLDLGGPWWLPIVAIVMLFPGAIGPWQRYCETVVVYAGRHVENGVARVPAEFVLADSVTAGPTTPASGRGGPGVLRFVAQMVGWSGQQLLLPICTVLDVVPAVPTIEIAGQPLPYLLIWLVLRAGTHAVAALKSVGVYGRRLKDLH